MPFPLLAVGAGLLGAASTIYTNAANAREARRNREFQERMSSTAHEREVKDLLRAGLNPMLSRGQGASTPAGDRAEVEDVGKGGLAHAMGVAQLKLVNAQADRESSAAQLNRTQAADINTTGASGRYSLISLQRDLADMDLQQRKALMPLVLQRAQQEIETLSSSARAASARALLDEAAAAGAANVEDFERRIGEAGPWVRFFFQLLKGVR